MRMRLEDCIVTTIDNRGRNPKAYFTQEEYPVIDNYLIKNTLHPDMSAVTRFIDEETFNKFLRGYVHRNMPIMTLVGNGIGNVTLAPSDKCAIIQNTIGFLVNDKIDQIYLYYYFLSEQERIKKFDRGSGQPSIRKTDILAMKINVPDIETQKRIVALLRSIEEKIENNQKINDNLQQQAQSIYHERFEGVSFDDLPFGWRVVTLGEVATISNKSFNPLKEPETMLEHYSIPAFDEARFPVFEPSTSIKSNKFIVDDSCFMISKLNPTTKRVWKPYCLTVNAVCSTEFIVYKAKDKSITDFLYSVIDSNSFSDFMCSHVTGSTGSRQRTTPSDTLSYELILPSDDELAEFQSLVSPMYAQIRINAIENDKLKRLRDSLLPKLMSGEINVSDIQL